VHNSLELESSELQTPVPNVPKSASIVNQRLNSGLSMKRVKKSVNSPISKKTVKKIPLPSDGSNSLDSDFTPQANTT